MSSQQPASPDVIVVGAGSAGCAVAARLVRRGLHVVLLEGGPAVTAPPLWSLAGATDPSMSVGDRLETAGGRTLSTRRGALVGGSGAVNGGYFVHSRAADHQRLADAGGDAWSDEALRAVHRRVMPETWVDTELDPVSEAFIETALADGFGWVEDLNGSVDTGVGLVPFGALDGERVTPATAYLSPLGGDPRLTVRSASPVRRVVIDDGRVQGVELAEGPVVHAPTVVLSAGSVGSAELLLRSGVGPAAHLAAHGIAVQLDVAGVGTRTSNHPCIDLMYLPSATARGDRAASFMQSVLHVVDDDWGGVVEVMATRRPYGIVTGTDPGDRLLSLRVTLMSPTGRGTVRLQRNAQIELCNSGTGHSADLGCLVRAVRQVSRLATLPAMAGCIDAWHGPAVHVLADDEALTNWVLDRVGTAYHLAGTAPMGPPGQQGSVVDGSLQVHGIEGLRVADLSVLPGPVSRGPAATAVMIGERAADLFG